MSHKNVNVVEKNYITAQKYLTRKVKLAFCWLIVFVTKTTPISSRVKDKSDILIACCEDTVDF